MDEISIHAPAKERRFPDVITYVIHKISIHAPAKERQSLHPGYRHPYRFQSTLPRRSDPESSIKRYLDNYFNPRSREGATLTLEILYITDKFQSTLPRRSDVDKSELTTDLIKFQSTLPRRSDAVIHDKVSEGLDFNPRSREGATCACAAYSLFNLISIHAPAKERQRAYTITKWL